MDWTRGHTIGRGSSATVSIATSHNSGDVFAVKSAELHQSESLRKETQILSSLSSPHVIGFKGYDITRENNKVMYNLFMDHAPGGSLPDATRRQGGKMEEQRIVYHARQILQGLEYIHSNGIVHCDIKGSNILITKTGAKIADFGCAKWVETESPATATRFGGTPAFMAPEVARGEHQGFASDIWSFGGTVIEMATGGSPAWGKAGDPISVIYRIGYSGELPEFPSGLSEEARDFLSKCLRRNPNERWSATQLLKHRFLNCETKQVLEEVNSDSPTSILDQGIWNSIEEYSESLLNLSRTISQKESASVRIRRLAFDGASLDWCDHERWMTIRDHDDDIIRDHGDDMNCCCMDLSSFGLEERKGSVWGLNCCVQDKYIRSDRFRTEKSVVISQCPYDRDINLLLIPSTSSIL